MIVNNKTHFGFESVNKNIKAKKVKDVFESVATKYDLMNSLMSGGLHKIWKTKRFHFSGGDFRQQRSGSFSPISGIDRDLPKI